MGRGSHYFSPTPASPSERRLVKLRLRDVEAELWTDRGVFAGSRVDSGTLALLETAPPPPPDADVLDLGCGYGPIAIALARRSPQARVWAVDVNERALELTRDNAFLNGCSNVHAGRPDELPPGLELAAIYSNPPVRIGKEPLHSLLSEWLDRLGEHGHAYLVVQRHLGSDSLARWLEESGRRVGRLASKKGYRILDVSGGSASGSK